VGMFGNFVNDVKTAKAEKAAKVQLLNKMGIHTLRAIAKSRKIKLTYYDGNKDKWLPMQKKTNIVNKMAKNIDYSEVIAICKARKISTSIVQKKTETKTKMIKANEAPLKARVKDKIRTTKSDAKRKAKMGFINLFI